MSMYFASTTMAEVIHLFTQRPNTTYHLKQLSGEHYTEIRNFTLLITIFLVLRVLHNARLNMTQASNIRNLAQSP